jgi:RNA polymerase sigma factor (TIGR02999 family)
MSNVTQLLAAVGAGDPRASAELLPLVYGELRRLATEKMARERPGQTLQATALVHEAYLRLTAGDNGQHWDDRWHFFAAAAEAMRRILVENARHKATLKCGGEFERVTAPEVVARGDFQQVDLLALDEALERLQAEHPEKAQLVNLRYFAGCTVEEAAEALGISRATAQRNWSFARAWLFKQLGGS